MTDRKLDEIRQVRMSDLDAVTEVETICFPAAEAAGREALAERIAAFPESFLVGIRDGKIIGFINGAVINERLIRDEMYADPSCHDPQGAWQSIFGLDVLPEYQHRGYGSELMEHLIREAARKGRKGLTLDCKKEKIGFYARFGYRLLGESASEHGGASWNDMILEFAP